MAAFTLHVPEHKLRVVAPDVGGGFGSKIFHYAEELLVTWASRRVGRPVKWTAERSESFIDRRARPRSRRATPSSRSTRTGKFLGLRVRTLANMGAYLSTFAPAVPTYLYATLLSGPYDLPGDLRRGEGDLHAHRRRSTRTAAPAGPRRRTCSSGSSTRRRASSAWTASSCGART